MAKTAKHFKVDDVDYEITQLGGVEGLGLYDRLCKELGPAITNAIRAGLLEKDAETKVAVIILEAMTALPLDFKHTLWVRFAGLTKIQAGGIQLPLGDGVKLQDGDTFDQHFAGRFGHMTRWLLAAMRWSFGDFLPASPDSGAAKAETKPSA